MRGMTKTSLYLFGAATASAWWAASMFEPLTNWVGLLWANAAILTVLSIVLNHIQHDS